MFDKNRTFLEGLRDAPHRLMHVQGSALPFLPAAAVHLVDAFLDAIFQRAVRDLDDSLPGIMLAASTRL